MMLMLGCCCYCSHLKHRIIVGLDALISRSIITLFIIDLFHLVDYIAY